MSLVYADVYDKLFAKFNGSGTSFVDSSVANPKTITPNADAKQIGLHADFSGARTAGFFNGSSDCLSVADSADWDFGTGDFDIQFYVNFETVPGGTTHLISRNDGSDGLAFSVMYNGTNLVFYTMNSTSAVSYGWSPVKNTWYKIKINRTGTAAKLYIDDVQVGSTGTDSTNITGAEPLIIGAFRSTGGSFSNYMHAWIKNLTVTKAGTTVLDMRFNSPANSPIAPAAKFDGTGDYLSAADSADWDFGTGDFTWEGFFCATASLGSGKYLIFNENSGSNSGFYSTNSGWDIYLLGSSVASGSYTLELNAWYHFAISRSGTNLRLFINGIQQGTTTTNSSNLVSDSSYRIGGEDESGSGLTGYMREVRISNIARYTANFTPSQSGFTVDANTKLYIKGNEANGATTFLDTESSPKTITTNGNVKCEYFQDYRSCIFKDEVGKIIEPKGLAKIDFFAAFGTAVCTFDGTGDSLTIPDSADFDFGTGDFTLEGFIRFSSVGVATLISRKTGGSSNLCDIAYTGSGDWNFYINNVTRGGGSAVFTPIANMWFHFAGTRSGTSVKLFINGTQAGSTGTDSFDIQESTPYTIGGFDGGGGFNGRMDNVRISKGVARYTATFNPPEDFQDASANFFAMF